MVTFHVAHLIEIEGVVADDSRAEEETVEDEDRGGEEEAKIGGEGVSRVENAAEVEECADGVAEVVEDESEEEE